MKKITTRREGDTMTFKLANGLTIEIRPLEWTDEIKEALLFHGAKQKITDAAAGAETTQEAFRKMQNVADRLASGLWDARGQDPGIASDLAAALAAVKGITVNDAAERLAKLDDERLKGIKNNPLIKAELLRIKAERAAKLAAASDDELDI